LLVLRNEPTAYDAVHVALPKRPMRSLLTLNKRLAASPGHHAPIELVKPLVCDRDVRRATNSAAFPPQGIGVPTMSAFASVARTFHSRKAVAAAPMCEQEIGQMRA